jgi:hypothetical protein
MLVSPYNSSHVTRVIAMAVVNQSRVGSDGSINLKAFGVRITELSKIICFGHAVKTQSLINRHVYNILLMCVFIS